MTRFNRTHPQHQRLYEQFKLQQHIAVPLNNPFIFMSWNISSSVNETGLDFYSGMNNKKRCLPWPKVVTPKSRQYIVDNFNDPRIYMSRDIFYCSKAQYAPLYLLLTINLLLWLSYFHKNSSEVMPPMEFFFRGPVGKCHMVKHVLFCC